MERASITCNPFWPQGRTGTIGGYPDGGCERIQRNQYLPQRKTMMEKAAEQLVAQGPLAAAMAIAIWWLASKIKDCEIDRQKLWDKISELARRHEDA